MPQRTLWRKFMNKMNIPIFIPHLGCNNDCVFCNQRSITGNKTEVSALDVKNIIDEYLTYKGDREAEVAFFGGSFTGLEIEKQNEYLDVAYLYVKSGQVTGIRLSTRPDYINDEILQNLKRYGVTTIELGVQSMCDDVLMASKRGHLSSKTIESASKIKEYGFKLGLQMMLGLPLDTKEKSIFTAKELVRLGADCVRVYPTVVLRDTYLYTMFKSGEYAPLKMEEAIDTAKEVLKIFKSANIPVIRVGLQETESLGGSIEAGPYHPAFGEMVSARIYRDKIEKFIAENKPSTVNVLVNSKEISKVVGQKRQNIDYFKNKFNITVNVLGSSDNIFSINGNLI